MIWKVLFGREKLFVTLPRSLNADTMFTFVQGAIDEQRDVKSSRVVLDFKALEFIEPVGVVVLSNLVEYLKRCGAKVAFQNHTSRTDATKFLDDSEFFKRYSGGLVFSDSSVRPSTIPLQFITGPNTQQFLFFDLMPWIGSAVGLTPASLATTRVSLEEIFHNVKDHSGVDFGCVFAQHFPNKRQIQIAISDFGIGIPDMVRTKEPAVDDRKALWLACQEGFTTQTNVQNRGAGLPTLMRYVTERNGGTVLLVAGKGQLTAAPDGHGKKRLSTRVGRGDYPGTLVRVILRTDTLERSAVDAEPEDFEW